ncbi:MAG: DUF4124 domain-containing protein [Gammaproteobacteria bacterium]|nr:DUF4124 domain-containing protein [Gammaproteobacteria bacterium]
MRHDWEKLTGANRSARHGNMREIRTSLFLASLLLLDTATAQTEIHKCTDADGGIVYSQMPCARQESVEPDKTEPAEIAETAEQVSARRESPVKQNRQERPDSEASRAACKKRYRDAIDVIDAEIGREFSSEKAEEYKQQLLALTRKLRQCGN